MKIWYLSLTWSVPRIALKRKYMIPPSKLYKTTYNQFKVIQKVKAMRKHLSVVNLFLTMPKPCSQTGNDLWITAGQTTGNELSRDAAYEPTEHYVLTSYSYLVSATRAPGTARDHYLDKILHIIECPFSGLRWELQLPYWYILLWILLIHKGCAF